MVSDEGGGGAGEMKTRWIWVAAGLSGATIFGWFTWAGAGLQSSRIDLPRQVARAKALGLPMEPEDLRPNPPVDDEDNAAPALRKALHLMQYDPATKEALAKRHAEIPGSRGDDRPVFQPGDWKVVEPFMALGREAARKKHCDFGYQWERGVTVLLPEPAAAKSCARLLAYHGVVLAQEGKVDQALSELRASRRLGALLAETPGLVSMLVSIAVDGTAMNEYSLALTAFADNPAALARTRRELDHLEPCGNLENAVRGEVVLSVATVRLIRSEKEARRRMRGDAGTPGQSRGGSIDSGLNKFQKAMLSQALSYWCDVAEAMRGQRLGPALDRELAKIDRAHQPWGSVAHSMASNLWMPVQEFALIPLYCSARRSDARAFADVLIFRASHGRLPKDLAEAGSHELDPFDGKPLRYKVEGQGFVVYCVGPDMTDNGGHMTPGHAKDKGNDVATQFKPGL